MIFRTEMSARRRVRLRLLCGLLGLWCCGSYGAFAQEASLGADEPAALRQQRIESERARMAARNRPGARIPYQPPRSAPSGVSPAPATVVRPPPATTLPAPAPALIMPCDQGGCFDTNANRYNGPPGGIYLDSGGRTCRQVGTSMQCF